MRPTAEPGHEVERLGQGELHADAGDLGQTGATGPREMGKVMGAVMPRFKGRVDGTRVRALAQEALQPPPEEKDEE